MIEEKDTVGKLDTDQAAIDALSAHLLSLHAHEQRLTSLQKRDRRSYRPEYVFPILVPGPDNAPASGSIVAEIPDCRRRRKSGKRCMTWACKPCSLLKTTSQAVNIASRLTASQARFQTMIVLQLPSPDLTDASRRLKRLRETLSDKGYPIEWAYTIEVGKQGNPHVHLLAFHDRLIPAKAVLTPAWGAGAHIRRVKSSLSSARYISKGCSRSHARYMALNGGRPFHYSPGFFPEPVAARVLPPCNLGRL